MTESEPQRSSGVFIGPAYRGLSHRPRDKSVVSFLYCINDPQPEGSHGKLHRTTKVLSHRRGSRVAARGERAAGGEAADHWVPCRRYAFIPWPIGRRPSAAYA